eukprot:scaffold72754_cov67-Phaeocystis_antarctica.AAC.1
MPARRRDSATTLLVADPPTALAVTAEGASCAARAVLSDSVARAQRLANDKREQRRGVSPATRLQRKPEICVTTNTRFCPEPASDSDAGPGADSDSGPGADSDSGPGGDHQLGTKQVFRPAPGRTLTPCPPPRLGRRRARVRTRRYLWTVQAARPACTVAVFHHLRADAS